MASRCGWNEGVHRDKNRVRKWRDKELALLAAALQDNAGALIGGDLAIELLQFVELFQRDDDLFHLKGPRVMDFIAGHLSLAGVTGEFGFGLGGLGEARMTKKKAAITNRL